MAHLESVAPRLVWVLLNPSTADATQNDPTLQRCLAFSRAWDYGRLDLVNLFALRATNPKALYRADDPVGPENDYYIATTVCDASTILVAWGSLGCWRHRDTDVLALLARVGTWLPLCLGIVQNGCPRYLLYVPACSWATPYRPRNADSLRPPNQLLPLGTVATSL